MAFLGLALLLLALVQILVPDESTRKSSPTESSLPPVTVESLPSTSTPAETTSTSSVPEEELAPTAAPQTTIAKTTRSTTSTTLYASVRAPEVEPNDFWYALATCESENGRTSNNQFQFMGGTEDKVGYYDGASYEEQKAMAQGWAARLIAEGTHPGSRAGWPECWWRAGGR